LGIESSWWMLPLLAGQALAMWMRTLVLRYPRDEKEGEAPFDITRLSVVFDWLLTLCMGLYFYLGLAVVLPEVLRWLPSTVAPGWRVATTLGVGWLLISINVGLGVLAPEAMTQDHRAAALERAMALGQTLSSFGRILIAPALALGHLAVRWWGGTPLRRRPLVTEDEIKTLVSAGEQSGLIEEDERDMIYSIFRLGDTLTREVMVPRIDIVALDSATPWEEALELIVRSGHSRIPVYEETIDNIIGVLYIKDILFQVVLGHQLPHLRQILRPAYFIPESKRLDTLLREMQQNKVQLAIVVDEYGGVAGVISLEDIVEEIVGEIQDEYDSEEPDVIPEETGYLFDARIALDDVQELLAIPLPLEEADSLGGFIYNQLGHIPAVGERLEYQAVTFEVIEVSGRRIRKVRAILQEKPEAEEEVEES